MAYFTIEDLTGRMEAVAFPKTFQEHGAFINEGKIVMVQEDWMIGADRFSLSRIL